jgi:hypothetical protein
LRVFRRAAPVVLLALLVGACSSSGSNPKPPVATPAGDVLASLAAKGAAASYSATYEFHQASPDTTATVQVWRTDTSLRVDVVAGATTATLLRTPSGSYSCSITNGKRSCLLVAGPGRPLPPPFDIAPASLFTTDLLQLADQTGAYDVKSAPPLSASGPAAGARCFDVTPAPATASASPTTSPSASPSAAAVPAGRYCFTADGLLAAATFPSGNTVRMTAAQVGAPPAAQFTPYAKPTPLPK